MTLVKSAVDIDQFKQLTKDILEEAKRQGATSAEASSSISQGFSVDVRLGEVETIEHQRDKGIAVVVYFDKRKGFASTTDISERAIRETVAAACNIAKFTQEDECAGLADAELMAYDYPELDLCYPWSISVDEAIAMAKQCEDFAMTSDKRITNSEGAAISTHTATSVYGNSYGFIGAYQGSKHSIHCVLIGGEGDNKQRDYGYSVARDVHDLASLEHIAEEAAKRTVARLNPRKLSTRKTPVIFAADIASSLLGSFIQAIQGGNLYRKASFLYDKLDQLIFPEFMHIYEDPYLPKGLGSAPFDNEGVRTKKHDIVKDGVLKSYVLNSYTARKLGMQTTGNAGGVHNLIVKPSDGDLFSLIRKMGTGLVVTEMLGQGVNIVTGDYSRGASGFWVENGEIQFPVEEITIAGNLKDMFAHLVAIGSDIDKRKSLLTGSIFLEQMMVAGS